MNLLLDNFIFGDSRNGSAPWDNSLYIRSNGWVNFQVVFVIPNFAQDYYDGNVEIVSSITNYTKMDYYREAKAYLRRNQLPFIDTYDPMLKYIIKSGKWENIKSAIIASGIDGDTFLSDGIHPNDLGAAFLSNQIDFFNY